MQKDVKREHSNTTLVKVKLLDEMQKDVKREHSNTTLVKVK